MKPWSTGSDACVPPAASAAFTRLSTSSRLAAETAKMPSVWVRVSQICFLVKSLKRASTSSITNASSLTIMQVALSSVELRVEGEAELGKAGDGSFEVGAGQVEEEFRGSIRCPLWPSGEVLRLDARGGKTHRSLAAAAASRRKSLLRAELGGKPEPWEQALGVEKRVDRCDPIARHLEHHQSPRVMPPPCPAGAVLAEGGRPARRRRHQPRAATLRPAAEQPGSNRLVTANPQRVRRHREGRVLVQQLGEGVDVVALERV